MAFDNPRHLFPQLLKLGWTPLPNEDKRCRLTGWDHVIVDAAQAEKWSRSLRWQAIGLRVHPPMLVLDFDIPDENLMALMRRMLEAEAPEVLAGLERVGQPPKTMFVLQMNGMPFREAHTRRWKFSPEKTAPNFLVQAFAGGGGAAQVGAFGAHTIDPETKEVVRSYAWRGRSPADTPLHDLPVLPRERVFAVLDAADRILEATPGLALAPSSRAGRGEIVTVYDLTPETLFEYGPDRLETDLEGLHEAVRLAEYRGDPQIKVTGSFTNDPDSGGSLRGLVSAGMRSLVIHDTKTGVTHRSLKDWRPAVESEPEAPLEISLVDLAWLDFVTETPSTKDGSKCPSRASPHPEDPKSKRSP